MSLETMTKIKALVAAALAALLPGCSPFSAVNLLVPRSGYTVHRNLSSAPIRARGWMFMRHRD